MQAQSAHGEMWSVQMDANNLEKYLAHYPSQISIAAINGPKSAVISGAKDTVTQVAEKLKADGVKIQQLTTSHAFHSPLMNGVIEPLKDFLSTIPMLKPSIPIISNLTGEIADAEMSSVDYWCNQILNPVLFMADIQALASTGCKNIIEIGTIKNGAILVSKVASASEVYKIETLYTAKSNAKNKPDSIE